MFGIGQITFNYANVDNFKQCITETITNINKIIEAFFLNDIFNLTTLHTTNVIDYGKNTFDLFKNLSNTIIPQNKNVASVGIRYLINNEFNTFDEIKAEPLISNPNNIFIESTFNFTNVSINDIDKKYNDKLSYYNDFKSILLENVIK